MCRDGVPKEPPFQARISGIPNKCSESDLMKFFQPMNLDGVSIKKKKGKAQYAFVQFYNRQDLMEAIKKNGQVIQFG